MFHSVEEAIPLAQRGNKAALEYLVQQLQPKIYGLALKMLWHPDDAKDATQEILLRIITRIGSFRGDSSFFTWAYRVGANHISNWRKSRLESQGLTFETFGRDLEEGLTTDLPGPDEALLFQEIRVGCTLGMLLCLDRPHRLAYILGEILEMDGDEAASILEIPSATYRKRLERARHQIISFMQSHCGLTKASNACRCSRRVSQALKLKRINSQHLLFAGDKENAKSFPQVLASIRSMEEAQRAVAVYRSHPACAVPDFTVAVRDLLASSGMG